MTTRVPLRAVSMLAVALVAPCGRAQEIASEKQLIFHFDCGAGRNAHKPSQFSLTISSAARRSGFERSELPDIRYDRKITCPGVR